MWGSDQFDPLIHRPHRSANDIHTGPTPRDQKLSSQWQAQTLVDPSSSVRAQYLPRYGRSVSSISMAGIAFSTLGFYRTGRSVTASNIDKSKSTTRPGLSLRYIQSLLHVSEYSMLVSLSSKLECWKVHNNIEHSTHVCRVLQSLGRYAKLGLGLLGYGHDNTLDASNRW